MNRTLAIIALGLSSLLPAQAGLGQIAGSKSATSDWKSVLAERVRAYGHRNLIVVADSAYPAQRARASRPL